MAQPTSAGSDADYSLVFPVVGLSNLTKAAIDSANLLDALGAPAQAAIIRSAYLRLVRDLEEIAVKTAKSAEVKIKEAEVQSRVRDDTHGGGGPRLGDFLGVSHPVPSVPGSVAVNFEPLLDANVGWWITNEEGSSARIGDTIRGLFYPGAEAPNPAQFREHPLFHATGGAKGVIQNPIPERRFVRDGGKEAEAEWHAAVGVARARFMRSCRSAIAAAKRRPKP